MQTGVAATVPDAQWTTSAAPEGEQFRLWQSAVDEAFVPVQVERTATGAFRSEVSVWRLGPIELSDFAAPAQTVRRTPAHIARQCGDAFFLNMPLTDGSTARQHGRVAGARSGDFVLLDGDQPFDLDFATPFRQISLKVPREVMNSRLADSADATAVLVPGGPGIGSIAGAAIRAAAHAAGVLDARAARAVGEQIVDLVALAVGGARPQRPSTSTDVLFAAARAEIDRRLADPDLSPAAVADRIGISTRYLHHVFAENGLTFGRRVQTQRLTRARRMLQDPARDGLAIGDVAAACGFADPSYFTRLFTRRHGVAPSVFRALR